MLSPFIVPMKRLINLGFSTLHHPVHHRLIKDFIEFYRSLQVDPFQRQNFAIQRIWSLYSIKKGTFYESSTNKTLIDHLKNGFLCTINKQNFNRPSIKKGL